MRKVQPITLEFEYANTPESNQRLKAAYNRIFEIAKQNILERRKSQQKGGEKSNDQKVLHLRSSSIMQPKGKSRENEKSGESPNSLSSESESTSSANI